MRFALLGDHPDGLAMAHALVASGRHELAAYTGPRAGAESLRHWGLPVQLIRDVEEVLADPSLEMVVLASRLADRPAHLRRALQSEHHVLCVHPADRSPDSAYEAALIQSDTHHVLLPLLPDALHPAFLRLAELIQRAEGPLGTFQLLRMERGSAEALGIENSVAEAKLSLPGWDILRTLGGEVAEVLAFAAGEAGQANGPLLVTGRFERLGLFEEMILPDPNDTRWQWEIVGSSGRAELVFPKGWLEPSRLTWQDAAGEVHEEEWACWDPWPALVEVFEAALAGRRRRPTWQTAIRSLELDDAARRSIERRRVSTLEYPEATEEAGFKGTMTLVGCGLLWVSLLLLILSAWVPWLKWAIVPSFVVFLGLQLLRWIVPAPRPAETQELDAPC